MSRTCQLLHSTDCCPWLLQELGTQDGRVPWTKIMEQMPGRRDHELRRVHDSLCRLVQVRVLRRLRPIICCPCTS